ncbi:ATPase-activating ribosome biosynthesis protein [Dispira simplex]|nr:ATPase-activating ribosome biosynthesis protein [Dispira simplex]
MKKTKFESDWLRQQAQAMDIELDDDLLSDDDDDGQKAQQKATVKAKIRQWKQELQILLEQPIITRTKVGGGKLVTTDTIQELLASQTEPAEYNPHISMLKLSRAVTDFEQNFKMKRAPRKVRWTKAFRKAAGKEMTIDKSLEFEKRRNIPVRYDRELMATTLKAMKRIQDIRQRREEAFYKNRMAGHKDRERQENIREVQHNIELVGAYTETAQVAMDAVRKKVLAQKQLAEAAQRQTETEGAMDQD